MENMGKRLWEQSFDITSRKYELSSDPSAHHALTSLYLEIERNGSEMIRYGGMPKDTSYDIQLEDGSFARVSFMDSHGEPRATLTVHTIDGNTIPLITESDLRTRDYRAVDMYMQKYKANIGHKFPDKLRDLINEEFKPGRLLTFDLHSHRRQMAYVCTRKKDGVVYLKEAHLGSFRDITAKKFEDAKERALFLNDNMSIQQLYNEVKSFAGNVLPRCEDIGCFAQEQINGLMSRLKAGKTAILNFGSEQLRAHKNRIGGKITWYDKDGTKISEEAAKVFIAWCHNAPVAVEVKNEEKLLGDKEAYAMYSRYEQLVMEKNFLMAGNILEDMSKRYGKDFSVDMMTYEDNGTEMPHAVSFCFKSTPEGCDIYKVTYRDNRFTDEQGITKIELGDFVKFCTDKFNASARAVADRVSAEFAELYAKSHLDKGTQERILNGAIASTTSKELGHKDVVGATNINDINPDINSLIDSYIESGGTSDEPVIYDGNIGLNDDEER